MSSDLPDTFSTPHCMAKSLATYMTDPLKIRRVLLDNFFSAPCVKDIAELIRKHKSTGRHIDEPQPEDAWQPDTHSRSMDWINNEFLRRLQHERDLSAAKWQVRDLNSTYLTQPALVNAAWDREAGR